MSWKARTLAVLGCTTALCEKGCLAFPAWIIEHSSPVNSPRISIGLELLGLGLRPQFGVHIRVCVQGKVPYSLTFPCLSFGKVAPSILQNVFEIALLPASAASHFTQQLRGWPLIPIPCLSLCPGLHHDPGKPQPAKVDSVCGHHQKKKNLIKIWRLSLWQQMCNCLSRIRVVELRMLCNVTSLAMMSFT